MKKTQASEGVALIPREYQFPMLNFLSNLPKKEKAEILGNYKEGIKRYGERARKALDIFDKNGNGSNPFAFVEMSKYLTLASPSELERAVEISPDFFIGTYEDIALVLRANTDSYNPNHLLAKSLAKELKRKVRLPARISLKGLELKENKNSHYGLVFKLTEAAEAIYVPEFSYENHGRRFSKTDERGVPIWDENGNRIFVASKAPIAGLFLGSALYTSSNGGDFAISGGACRVACVRTPGASPKN